MTIFVNADWSAIVPAGSAETAFGIQPRDAKRLGIDKLPVMDGADVPDDLPDAPETVVLSSASPEPAPETKEAPTPEDKAAPKPANKGAARKDTVDGDRN